MIVHMIGNAHIDPVWLWPWQAGVDESLATLAAAADRCDEYPDFIFTRGEAWAYMQAERLRPDLFRRIGGLIERGQWHVTGGWYLQPDLNLPTEMGLRRQIRRGQAYFARAFGLRPNVAYQVDSFGQPAFMPGLLVEHGYLGYVFCRPKPKEMPLPASLFRWRGSDGAEILAFRIVPTYTTNFADLFGQVMLALESAGEGVGHTMCFYGVGNHGGGPTQAHIEWIRAHRHAFPGAELRFSTPQLFFEAVAPSRTALPLIEGELQRTFPGCYSVMHDIKSEQRRGEHLLDQAERTVAGFVDDPEQRSRSLARLETAWDDLLFTEFHDIVTGTSIKSAWPACRALQARARLAAEEMILETTRIWSYRTLPRATDQQIVAMNPDETAFKGYLETEPWLDFDDWGSRWLADEAGAPVPLQQIQPEAMQAVARILFPAKLAAGAASRYSVRPGPSPATALPDGNLVAAPDRLANDLIEVRLGPGGIEGLSHGGRSLLGAGGIGLHLRRDRTDTWSFHTDRWIEPIEARLSGGVWIIEESGPLRARARMDARLGSSRLRWTVSLCRDEAKIRMDLEINFDERFRLLQMPIALAHSPEHWTDGMAIGAVARAPSPAEWPVQGWSRVGLGSTDLAVITNDAYSLSLEGKLWQWTLLRSPRMAWDGGVPTVYGGRDDHTDQGVHAFAFELMAGVGLGEAELRSAARRQAQPPIVFDRYEGMARPSYGALPPRRIWDEAMQRNLRNGRIKPVRE